MARTDAHRPYYVLEVDEPQMFREWHDHRDGICDLVPDEASAWFRGGHCYRIYVAQARLCGCSWCGGGGYYGRRERRWHRHITKRLINDILKLRNWEDADIWPRYATPW